MSSQLWWTDGKLSIEPLLRQTRLTLSLQVDVCLSESFLLQEPCLSLGSLLLRFERVVLGVYLRLYISLRQDPFAEHLTYLKGGFFSQAFGHTPWIVGGSSSAQMSG